MSLDAIYDKVKTLRDRVDDLQIFIDFKETKSRFALANLDGFFERLVDQRPTGAELIGIFRRGAYQEWINNLYSMDLRLGRFRRENHEQLIAEFRYLDKTYPPRVNRVIKRQTAENLKCSDSGKPTLRSTHFSRRRQKETLNAYPQPASENSHISCPELSHACS